MHLAAQEGHIEVVSLLLDRGASVDAANQVGGYYGRGAAGIV